ncbi:MAG: hypothetical protein ACKOXK_05955 [Chakrabartia sp.]
MLLALGLRLLIPTGFMPTVSPQGLVVELCSGISGKTATIDIGKNIPGQKQLPKADSACVFATGLGHGLLASVDLPTILPFVYGLTYFVGAAIADLTVSRLAAPPPPSQGPPALR